MKLIIGQIGIWTWFKRDNYNGRYTEKGKLTKDWLATESNNCKLKNIPTQKKVYMGISSSCRKNVFL